MEASVGHVEEHRGATAGGVTITLRGSWRERGLLASFSLPAFVNATLTSPATQKAKQVFEACMREIGNEVEYLSPQQLQELVTITAGNWSPVIRDSGYEEVLSSGIVITGGSAGSRW